MKKPLAILIFSGVLFAVLCYVVFIIYVATNQTKYIFFPVATISDIADNNANTEAVSFETADGETLGGLFVDNDGIATVLFFHGNAGNSTYESDQIEVFNRLQVDALLVDYRGYGTSTGRIREETDLYRDADAAVEYLKEVQGVPTDELVIWGRSLGGAVAIDTAVRYDVARVIVESTFYSMDEMARQSFPLLPIQQLSNFHFRSDEKIGNIEEPLLMIHSSEDEVIPYSHGTDLYNKATTPKEFLAITGDHATGFVTSDTTYMNAVNTFVKQ